MNCKYCGTNVEGPMQYNSKGEWWHIGCKEGYLPVIEDAINHPTHYHQNGIDVIGFSELQFPKEELKGFYRINILKYVTRYDRKNGVQDLEKAEFYLKKLMEVEKNG